ncbi:hypothetical protein MPSEU_000599800 [Mayamaea pseudoterrestris]|nr:hypothetical protein MPSEU_000599800 [Mayamaea pseudoterrestris]
MSQGTQQLHDLVRALEIIAYDDTVALDPPEETNTASFPVAVTAAPTEAPVDQIIADQLPQANDPDDTPASAFNATTDISNYFDNSETDCTFSSNPDTLLCNVTAFRCSNSQSFVTIPYDYEIVHKASEVSRLSHLLEVIEGNILDQLSMDIGLKNCAKSFGGRRAQAETSFGNGQMDYQLTGMSLLPRDKTTTEKCLSTIDHGMAVCSSIKGALTVYTLQTTAEAMLSNQERLALQQAVLEVIQEGMLEEKFLTSAHGEKVVYIGDRLAVLSSQQSQTMTETGWTTRSKGLVSAAIILSLLVIAVLCYIRCHFKFGKGSRYVRDTSGSSVDTDARPDTVEQMASNSSSLGPQDLPAVHGDAKGIPTTATKWNQSGSQDQGTECIEFDKPSELDESVGSMGVATFDLDTLVETTTDIGNYQFSYDQGISPINETFDNLYEDVEIPMTFDDASGGSVGQRLEN